MEDQENRTTEEQGQAENAAPGPATGQADNSNRTVMGVLAYLGLLVLVPLLVEKKDPFVKFHVKQGLALAIVAVGWGILLMVPLVNLLLLLVSPFVWLFILAMAIIGIVNVVNGKEKELPLLGILASKLNI